MISLITTLANSGGLFGINSLKGGFLASCLAMAGLLILGQTVVAIIAANQGEATPSEAGEKIKEAAEQLRKASAEIQNAAVQNRHAASANTEAATTSGASTTAGVHALRLMKADRGVLELLRQNQPDAGSFLANVNLDVLDAETKANDATVATDKATKAAEKASAKAEEAAETADKATSTSFLATLQAVALKNPLVGAALLFTILGAIGANLIKFSIT